MEQLIDFSCDLGRYEFFHSDDPVVAARFVVSDSVHLLWARLRDEYGFEGLAARAAPQLVRWESAYGWTRSGFGQVSEKENSLASIVSSMLPAPELWVEFTDRYLDALDELGAGGREGRARSSRGSDRVRKDRTRNLAEWHRMLLERLGDFDADDRLDRLIDHGVLGGPELTYLGARLAHQRGDIDDARQRIYECLESLPGHQGFLNFAAEIGASLPPRAERAAQQRLAGRESSR